MVKISSKFIVVLIFFRLIADQFFAINRSSIFFSTIFDLIDFLTESMINQIRSIIFKKSGLLIRGKSSSFQIFFQISEQKNHRVWGLGCKGDELTLQSRAQPDVHESSQLCVVALQQKCGSSWPNSSYLSFQGFLSNAIPVQVYCER